jgi:hypothetical protein
MPFGGAFEKDFYPLIVVRPITIELSARCILGMARAGLARRWQRYGVGESGGKKNLRRSL